MKAITLSSFGSPEVLQLNDVAKPVVGPGEVLLKVHATSVNKPDIVQRQGNYPPPKGDSELLGLEVAGVVAELGEGVSEWSLGDRVIALVGGGGYAEYVLAKAGHCMALPESLTFNEGACICETYITAFLNVFLLAELSNKESVLLHGGGGGVNTAAIQLCRSLTPDATILVTASSAKVERVAEMGAHLVIDYQNNAFADVVKEYTQGKGVNVILDHIGADYLAPNMKSLSVEGRLVIIGVTSGIKAEINLALMMVKRQRILGSVLRSRSVEQKSNIISQFNKRVMPMFAAGVLKPEISHVFDLADARQAHETMERSQHFGKIVLSVSND